MSEYIEEKKEQIVKMLIEAIEKHPQEWEAGWIIPSTRPENGKTGSVYHGMNAFLLTIIGMNKSYADNRWVTYEQSKELGAQVKKGEKGVPVVFFRRYDEKTKKDFEEKTVEEMTATERMQYEKENVHNTIRFYTVFNGEQCDNFPTKTTIAREAMTEEEIEKQNAEIEKVIGKSEAEVNYDGGSRAYYDIKEDKIHLPKIEDFKTKQDYYATALHEIAHSTGHASRLNRDLGHGYGTPAYAVEELRAEIASVFMQMELGTVIEGKHFENHAAYMDSWLKECKGKDGFKTMYAAAADAEKISGYMMEKYAEKETAQEKKSEEQKTTEKSEWKEMLISKGNVGKEYEKSRQITLPKEAGKLSNFVFYVPTKLLKEADGGYELRYRTDYEFTLKNDGRKAVIKGEQLEKVLAGEEIENIEFERFAPSWQNAKRYENLEKNVPNEMKEIPNWCAYYTSWNAEKGKKDKVLIDCKTGKRASPVDKETWSSFEEALNYAKTKNYAGVSFALTKSSGITCIDLDKCIGEDGEYTELAKEIIEKIPTTYAEKSVSGNGVHIFIKDDILQDGKYGNRHEFKIGREEKGDEEYQRYKTEEGAEIEVYEKGRIMSMTGEIMEGREQRLTICPTGAKTEIQRMLGAGREYEAENRKEGSKRNLTFNLSDSEVYRRASRCKDGAEFEALYQGQSITGDHSRDDYRLIKTIGYFSNCDEAQTKKIFMASGLYRPEKGEKYVNITIEAAFKALRKAGKDGIFYNSGKSKGNITDKQE